MVQILNAPQRRPSVGQRLAGGVGRGLEQASEMLQQHETQKQQAVADADIAAQYGVDLRGKSTEERKILLQQALSGQNQQQLEMVKQQGRKDLMGEKQGFLSKILGGGRQEGQQQQSVESEGQQFDPSRISDVDIAQAAAIDPNLARELRYAKDSALREKRADEKMQLAKEKMSPEHKREELLASTQAQADVKYNANLQETSKQHELKEKTLNNLERLNRKGVTGKPWEKFAEKAGLVNITSEGRREFSAEVKNLITDIRSILGGQFSNFEFQTILNAYPSADFSKDANSAIIKNLKSFQDIKKKEVEYAESLKKENRGKIPEDFQSKVNEMVRAYANTKKEEIKQNTQRIMAEEYGITKGNILMLDPEGEPLDVSPDEVAKYESLGATLP